MFVLSKVFWWLFEPSNLVLLILVIGSALLWTQRWRRMGAGSVSCATAILVAVSVIPIDRLLIAPLEDRFPQIHALPGDAAGIISLGGAVDQLMTRARNQTALSGAVERLTTFVALARRYPRMKLVYTGGSASLIHPEVKEVLVVKRLFGEIGFNPDRVIFEDQSRNTHENALLTRELVRPKPGERWVLLTSAFHMPRSVGVFRAAGWDVIPYPVDYQINPDAPVGFWRSPKAGLGQLSAGMHEWIGLLAYRLLGRTDAVFPGPTEPE